MKYTTCKTKIFKVWHETETEALRAGIPAKLLTRRNQLYCFDAEKAVKADECFRIEVRHGVAWCWYFEPVTLNIP